MVCAIAWILATHAPDLASLGSALTVLLAQLVDGPVELVADLVPRLLAGGLGLAELCAGLLNALVAPGPAVRASLLAERRPAEPAIPALDP
jgi:hypothetical protein